MTFLVLLLVLALEKFSAWRASLQRDGLWLGWLNSAQGQPAFIESPWLIVLLLVALPPLLLVALLHALAPLAYGWLLLPLHVLTVLYSLGRGDVQGALGPFRDSWRRGDGEAAYLVAQRDLGVEAGEPDELLRAVQGHLAWQAYQGFFAVIFWYCLLGPAGALAYRLLALMAEQARLLTLRECAERLRHGADWLPVRALAISFALVGRFVEVSRVLLHELLNRTVAASALVIEAATAGGDSAELSLGIEGVASLDALWQLLVRAAVLWYALLALWTLFS